MKSIVVGNDGGGGGKEMVRSSGGRFIVAFLGQSTPPRSATGF